MMKSRNNETTMVKTRKHDDTKIPISRWWKVETTKVRWWKLEIISYIHNRTLELSPSWYRYRYFVISSFHHRLSTFHYRTIAFFTIVFSYFDFSLLYYRVFTIVVSRFHDRTIPFIPSCFVFCIFFVSCISDGASVRQSRLTILWCKMTLPHEWLEGNGVREIIWMNGTVKWRHWNIY